MESCSYVFENGFEVILVPDRSLPFIEAQGWIKSGSALEVQREAGSLVPPMLLRGTNSHSKEEFENMMDDHAIEYGAGPSSISPFFVEFSGRALKARAGKMMELIFESLSCPSFPESELDILKAMQEAGIHKNESDPETRALEEIRRMLYGPNHPLFMFPADESVARLRLQSRDVIYDFWKKYYAPDRAGIALVGDMDPESIRDCVRGIFGKWNAPRLNRAGDGDISHIYDFYPDEHYEERVVFIPQKSSAVLRIGSRVSISSAHKDYPALRAAVFVLGDGTNSRLFRHVREKHGLSYNIWALPERMHTMSGYFSVVVHTNPDNISRTQEETWRVVSEFCEHGISEEELQEVKSSWRGSRVYSRASFKGVAQEIILGKIIGSPVSELDERMYGLCADEVNVVISKYLNPERMKVVRAGTVAHA